MTTFPTTRPKHLQQSFILFLLVICISLKTLAQPAISSFSPQSGPVGTSVTITGTNFNTTAGNNTLYIGGIKADVTAATATSLTAIVPAGAMYQPVSVTVNGQTAFSNQPFIVSFSGGASAFTPQSFLYAGRIDSVNSNTETTKYAIGDIDGDRKLDVITIDRLNNTMSVYRNTTAAGSVSFAPKVDYPTGQSPRSVAIADLDGDGRPEAVVTNNGANTVSIFKNASSSGVISFAAKADFATATQPAAIAVTDLDKDGYADLVINTVNLDGFVSVLRNTGSIGSIAFAPSIDLSAVGGSIEEIRTADIDGDNKADIIVPNYGLNRITIFRNTSTAGAVSFAAKTDIVASGYPAELEVADLNDDGKPDLAVTYYLSGTFVSVFRNTSSAGVVSFNNTSLSTGKVAYGLTINDLDGDGKPDVAVGSGSDSVALFRNISSAGGAIAFNAMAKFASPWNTQIITGDIDSDGKPDLNFESGIYRVTVWKNATTKPQLVSFSPVTAGAGATITLRGILLTGVTAVSFGGVPATSFTVVDDGTITATVGSGNSGAVTVTAPHGDNSLNGFTYVPAPLITSFNPVIGRVGQTVTITGNNFTGATAVSFGGVPAASFTVINANTINALVGSGASGDVSVTTLGGTGLLSGFTFIPPPHVISFTPTTGNIGATVIITGANFDGATDVRFGGIPAASFTVLSPTSIKAEVSGGSSGYVKVITPGGADSLNGFVFIAPPVPVITNVSPMSGPVGTVVTITGNNFNSTASLNYVYFGPAKATVTAASSGSLTVVVPPGATYGHVSVTTNFLTAVAPQAFVTTFAGGGDITSGSFSEFTTFKTGNGLRDICITDFDGDGNNDVVGASYYSLSVLRNNSVGGNISFEPTVNFAANSDLLYVKSADIDGDGKKDIVARGDYSSTLSIFRNTSTPGVPGIGGRTDFRVPDYSFFAVGDLDADGKPDIVVSSDFSLTVYKNVSVGSNVMMNASVTIPLVNAYGGVKVGDIDGDGKQDIVLLNDDYTVSIFRNTGSTGNFSFAPPVTYTTLVESAGSFGPTDIFIADLDDDGKPEIAIANTAISHAVSILKNNSSPGVISFPVRKDCRTGSIEPFALSAEDLDGDGKPDFAFTHEYVPRTVCAMKNGSTVDSISFAANQNVTDNTNAYLSEICTGDLNNDGQPEIIANGSSLLYVFKNKTTGPHIRSFLPVNGIADSVVTITGSNFTGTTAVSFGGVAAKSFIVQSPTSITAVIGTGASGNVAVTTPLGSESAPGFLYGLVPVISSFTPTSARTGDTVIIKGINFTGATFVRFGGSLAYFTVNSDTTITATLNFSYTGNVTVQCEAGTATATGFTFIPPPPTVYNFYPRSGTTGTSVTIQGSAFIDVASVSIGGIPVASYKVLDVGTITAVVGAGATGNVSVTTTGGTGGMGTFNFIPPSPAITSFTPTSAATGTTINITGTDLTGATIVTFGGIPATSFTVVNASTITAIVGTGATGPIMVVTPGGAGLKNGFTFIPPPPPPPVITSFSPDTAGAGSSVTVIGNSFTGATAVSFGGTAARSFIVSSDTRIIAEVGYGATGSVKVTTPAGTATRDGFTFDALTAIVDPGNVNTKELTVSPNPSHDLVVIRHPASVKNARLRFIDILGHEVKTIIPVRTATQTETSVIGLRPGVYTILWSEGTRNLTRVFVVQ